MGSLGYLALVRLAAFQFGAARNIGRLAAILMAWAICHMSRGLLGNAKDVDTNYLLGVGMRNENGHFASVVLSYERGIRWRAAECCRDDWNILVAGKVEVEATVVGRGYGRNKQYSQAAPPPVTFHPSYAVSDGSVMDCRGVHDTKEKCVLGIIREYCTRCNYSMRVGCLSS